MLDIHKWDVGKVLVGECWPQFRNEETRAHSFMVNKWQGPGLLPTHQTLYVSPGTLATKLINKELPEKQAPYPTTGA